MLRGFDTVSRIVIIGSMMPELISPEYLGRWRGVLGLFGGIASILGPLNDCDVLPHGFAGQASSKSCLDDTVSSM